MHFHLLWAATDIYSVAIKSDSKLEIDEICYCSFFSVLMSNLVRVFSWGFIPVIYKHI